MSINPVGSKPAPKALPKNFAKRENMPVPPAQPPHFKPNLASVQENLPSKTDNQ